MARRVVRDSGFTFVHGHSRSKFASESDEEGDGSKKNHVSQANKLKREERLNEIDDLLQNNKGLQEQIMQKLDEARALNASTEINELQADLSKLQSQQVSLQLEQKELRKKQRRSERYYTNKQTKDSASQNDSVQGDDVEMVGDVSLQDELAADDRSEEGLPADNVAEAQDTAEQSRTISVPEAVVTQILPPATGIPTSSTNTGHLAQRQEPLNPEEESSVRALYTAFMPHHLQTEVVQQVQQQSEGGHVIPAGYTPALVNAAAVSSDPTINALLSLGAKDKVLLPGMLPAGVSVAAVPVTSGVPTTSTMTPGITVVMPGQPLQGNVNVPWQ